MSILVEEAKLRGCLTALYERAYKSGYNDSEIGEAPDTRSSEMVDIIIDECRRVD